MLRRVIAVLVCAGLTSVPISAAAGASADRPTRFVRAAGEFTTSLNANGTQAVEFACVGVSGPDSAGTMLTECSIWVDGVEYADFPRAASGNATVSAGRHDVPLGSVKLCYAATALYVDGSTASTPRDCV
ncbi:MAG TPA: hypothetical protein VHN37_15015 [Actinomycetota bacterium]|nr:hypothetical protein [Actinomycetota bacterium]